MRLSSMSARSAAKGGCGQGTKASGLLRAVRLISALLPMVRQTKSGSMPMIEWRPRTAPPSTDSSRKLSGLPPPSLRKAETGVSRSPTKVVHTTCACPRP
jgi:hypothetical protein